MRLTLARLTLPLRLRLLLLTPAARAIDSTVLAPTAVQCLSASAAGAGTGTGTGVGEKVERACSSVTERGTPGDAIVAPANEAAGMRAPGADNDTAADKSIGAGAGAARCSAEAETSNPIGELVALATAAASPAMVSVAAISVAATAAAADGALAVADIAATE